MKIKEIGLLLFYDWLDRMRDLPADEFKSAVYALSEYQRKGTDPVEGFNGSMRVLVGMMLDQIQRAESISASRSASGKKGADRTNSGKDFAEFCRGKAEAKNDKTEVCRDLPQQISATHTHTHTNTLISPPIIPPLGGEKAASGDAPTADVDVMSERFDRFWDEYPNKTGKQAARSAWKKIKPSEALTRQMIAKVKDMKKTDQWKREDGRFIPNPTTWLNQGRWEDEAPKPSSAPETKTERLGSFDAKEAFKKAIERTKAKCKTEGG